MTKRRTIDDPGLLGRTMTVGEADRDRLEANYRRCVRCGKARPAPDLFICGGCEADPATRFEIATVEEMLVDYREQRAALVRGGWAGGWWRK